MKNSQNYGVQELNTEETKGIEGGIGITLGLIAIGYGIYSDLFIRP